MFREVIVGSFYSYTNTRKRKNKKTFTRKSMNVGVSVRDSYSKIMLW